MDTKDLLICNLCQKEIKTKIIYCLSDIYCKDKQKVNGKCITYIKHPFVCEHCYNKFKNVIKYDRTKL